MRTVDYFGKSLFKCKLTVTLVRSPIKYGKSLSTNYDPYLVCVVSRVHLLTLNSNHLICLSCAFFAEYDSVVTVGRKKQATLGCISIAFIISLLFFLSNGKAEYNYVYDFTNRFCDILHYCSIKSNLLFCSLNINKASKQHTRVLFRSFSLQVHGLR